MALDVQAGVVNDLVLLSCVGVHTVLVHGGGPEINVWLNKLGIEAQFKNGLRVTDGAFHRNAMKALQHLIKGGVCPVRQANQGGRGAWPF